MAAPGGSHEGRFVVRIAHHHFEEYDALQLWLLYQVGVD
jgi:hypothetical protein